MVLESASEPNREIRTNSLSSCADEDRSSSLVQLGSCQRLVDKINQRIASKDRFFSLEFFPPRTENGAVDLFATLERMSLGSPLFCDVTWHSAGNPGSDCETSSITIASAALNFCGTETMLHMICSNMTTREVDQHLCRARDSGIKNILALRGDPTEGDWRSTENGFNYAVDLVRYIRKAFGDYFSVGVAGYPNGHPDCPAYETDLVHLKAKVDAGADFIITQLFFDADTYFKYVDDCRRIGITVPIIPGVMPIQNYKSMCNIVKLTKIDVPLEITEIVQPMQDDDDAICEFGISHAVEMVNKLLSDDRVPGIHFFTMNREFATVQVLRQVGLWCPNPHRPLPWKLSAHPRRCTENVRPIFWSSRPKSYIYRTQNWDEFPNGRWNSSELSTFGDLKDYHMFFIANKSSKQELLRMWGKSLEREQDIRDIFCCYISGQMNRHGAQVTKTPWNEDELSKETSLLKQQLVDINRRGVLTINSQPRANAVPSSDYELGWGYPGGHVYQKAYLEFFTCRENMVALRAILPQFPQVNYHIINKKGDEDYTNCQENAPIAVTWGVFPGRDIIQPTVVDPVSFKVWKDEAFDLWLEQWGRLYPAKSPSRKLIKNIGLNYYLVNLVDNDFTQESCLWNVIETMFEYCATHRSGELMDDARQFNSIGL